MSDLFIVAGVVLAAYAAFVLGLVLLGRRTDARAWAGFIPDCVVLVKRLLGDPALPRGSKLLLGALAAYLAMPIDLVPDFLPVAGQLDDAIIVALVLRRVLRDADRAAIARHWPGPPQSLAVVLRLAGL